MDLQVDQLKLVGRISSSISRGHNNTYYSSTSRICSSRLSSIVMKSDGEPEFT